jgi:UMF1 family MFS transporter
VIGSFAIGWLAARLPLRSVLMAVVIGWVISLFIFVFVESRAVIWTLGSVVGVLLGGLWTTTRPMLAEMVPRRELGRFFGLFSLSGRAAAVVGPLVWTAVVFAFHPDRPAGEWLGELLGVSGPAALQLPYRLAIVSLALMMLVGLAIFRKVRPTQPGDNHA